MYFVSRQRYWPTGDSVVEICTEGKDYCNPDMLVPRFGEMGEGTEFADPMEAVEAAIKIRDAWNKLFLDFEDKARVEVGSTMGYTMPFEEHPIDEQLRDWAEKELESLPKCCYCGDILKESEHKYLLPELDDGEEFCSEQCAEWFLDMVHNDTAWEEGSDVQEGE